MDATLPPPAVANPLIGAPLVHIASGETFKVLCSCPSSSPRHHTRRHIMKHPGEYRQPTVQEIQQWHSKTQQAKPA